ncbi:MULTISPECIES: hypothetical protein [Caproicibacterium]|jgi:hypothetical protein|uniref:Uncharacterized protein n=1 Tax=Caproicibacterium lactatifermentans TaxID=2666138 RepID=A0A859DQC8_9FIRM|nr:hypothetical protein [Caproicibacterium lactatifermentans]QKN24297.1 hypothetical protein GJQ69_07215 [Caproicibacterium lactatifermentans]
MDWKRLYLYLKEHGYDVYSMGQHKGKCTAPYIVLCNNGSTRTGVIEYSLYELLLYYPTAEYSNFESYIDGIEKALNPLFPTLKLTDGPGVHYLDTDINAYMTSLTYQVQKFSATNRV